MRKIAAEIAAGVAIFLAFVIFIFGFLVLKNTAFRAGRYNLTIRFTDITGLERSDHVSVSGLRVGKVESFRLEGINVLVEVEIDPEVKLPKDSHAEIKSLGMVGEKFIDLIPGLSTEILQDGDSIQGKAASDFDEITGTMEGLMQQAEELLIKLSAAFENVFDNTTQRNLKESVLHFRDLTSALDRNRGHLEKTLSNLDELSTNINEILAERRSKVETSIDNFQAASDKLEGLTNKMDRSLTSMQALLAKIENQEGSVGKVIASDEFYNDIRHLTAELDELVQDLKKRPQKYLNLGFIKVF